jgi:uncharacterized protein YacL
MNNSIIVKKNTSLNEKAQSSNIFIEKIDLLHNKTPNNLNQMIILIKIQNFTNVLLSLCFLLSIIFSLYIHQKKNTSGAQNPSYAPAEKANYYFLVISLILFILNLFNIKNLVYQYIITILQFIYLLFNLYFLYKLCQSYAIGNQIMNFFKKKTNQKSSFPGKGVPIGER